MTSAWQTERRRELEREIAHLELTLRLARLGCTSEAERIRHGSQTPGRWAIDLGMSFASPKATTRATEPGFCDRGG